MTLIDEVRILRKKENTSIRSINYPTQKFYRNNSHFKHFDRLDGTFIACTHPLAIFDFFPACNFFFESLRSDNYYPIYMVPCNIAMRCAVCLCEACRPIFSLLFYPLKASSTIYSTSTTPFTHSSTHTHPPTHPLSHRRYTNVRLPSQL